MEATQFMEHAKQDEKLNLLLQEVAQDAAEQIEIRQPRSHMVTGVDLLIAMAAYTLFRWLKDYFDNKRALNEIDIVKQQEKIIAALIKDGFNPEDAAAVTTALLDRVAKRGKDDPAFKTALGLIGIRD